MAAKKKISKKAPAKRPSKKPSSAKKPARKPASKPKSSASKSATARRAAPRKPQRKAKRPAPRGKRAPARKVAKPQLPQKENAEALALARTIAHAALEKKASDVVIIDTRAKGSSVGYDYVVLASGDSDRQLEAIADSAEDAARAKNRKPTSVESSPDWVLSNFDDVVAHFFTPDKRGAYDLEGLWSDAPRVALA